MTLLSLVEVLQLGVYLLLAGFALLQRHRHRSPAATWLAGTVLVLTVLVTSGHVMHPADRGVGVDIARRAIVMLLGLFPYSLFRFTDAFARQPRWARRLALALTLLVAGGALVLPSVTPRTARWPWWMTAYAAAMALQWTALSVLSVAALWRSGRGQPHMARQRMRLLAAGTLILNLALLILVGSRAGGSQETLLWQQSSGLIAGVLFLVGFAPPSALRGRWRRRELDAFRSGEAELMAADSEERVAAIVLPHAMDVVGARGAALVSPDRQVRAWHGVGDADARALAAGLPVSDGTVREPLVRPDLVAVPVRAGWLVVATTAATPLFGNEEIRLLGTLAHLAGLALDRIELFEKERASRRALAERELQLARAQHTARLGSYTWDLATGQVTWSDELYRLLGYSPDEALNHGDAFFARIHPDDLDKVREAWTTARTNPAPGSWEFRAVLPGGEVRWMQGRLEVAVEGASGGRRLVGTIQDITERKEAEARLQQAVEREQQMVAELTELARVKTDFVSTISHELRTPLTSIAGYVELLSDGAVGDLSRSQLDVLEVVDRNARRLMALIEDLLTLSRIDSGGFSLTTAPLDVVALVEGVHRAVLPSAFTRGLTLGLDVDPNLETLVGDAAQLDRVLLNLLSNAIKFTPSGGHVALRVWREGGDMIFQVIDTGIGIPIEEQEQLFSRFFRSSTATDHAIQGTGLGLAIVKTIVEEHGGRISIESELGAGTTVTFSLPLSAEPTAPPEGRREAEPANA